MDYCRGVREIQSEFLGIFSETCAGTWDVAPRAVPLPLPGSMSHMALRAKVAERAISSN